jgi:hypothetical protein
VDMGWMGFCFRIRYGRLRPTGRNKQRERRNGDHRRDS